MRYGLKLNYKYILFILMAFWISMTKAQENSSEIYIKVGEAQIKKSLMAFPALQFASSSSAVPQHQKIGIELYKIISRDLEVTGYFDFIDPKSFLEDTSKVSVLPFPEATNGFKYESWKTIGAEFLLRLNFSVLGDQLSLEAYCYHIPKMKKFLTKKYKGSVSQLSKLAHSFSNDLVRALTGKEGMFLSKVVVSSSKSGSKFKEIYIMDWDGGNIKPVTSHNSIALSPNWSPDGKKIIYTAFVAKGKKGLRNPDLFMLDLVQGKRWLISDKLGMNSGGTFHPNGQSILLTQSEKGNPDIVRLDMEGVLIKKLTNGPVGALNVEPAVSPDGTRVAFSSDRTGKPMIWVMDIDGKNPTMRTAAGVYNSSPSWSPDGKKIAFAGLDERHYDIFIMDADGSKLERLTSAKKEGGSGKWSSNEDPVFSPDGRHIMFTSDRDGVNQVYIINTDGSNEHRITFDRNNYYKPRWSKNFD